MGTVCDNRATPRVDTRFPPHDQDRLMIQGRYVCSRPLFDLALAAGRDVYHVHGLLAHVSWVGSVLRRFVPPQPLAMRGEELL